MKGAKIRVVFVYILILVIIGLVGYLIYNFFMNNSGKDATEPTMVTENIISDECTFDVSSNEYSNIINGQNSNLCGGFNKLTINDIILDGKDMDVSVIYYNGNTNNDGTGMYIDDKRIIKNASKNYKNNIGVFNNKLFIFSLNDGKPNVVVYDSLGERIYDLETALAGAKIDDPAFTELSKTYTDLDTTVKNASINSNSFSFGADGFTFSTNSKLECKAGDVIGSTYNVAFDGTNFAAPQFVSYVNCNG